MEVVAIVADTLSESNTTELNIEAIISEQAVSEKGEIKVIPITAIYSASRGCDWTIVDTTNTDRIISHELN